MIQLKKYQEKAVKKLESYIKEGLEHNRGHVYIFKGPTSCGKTITDGAIIECFKDKNLAFAWLSPRKLYKQSFEELENYFEQSGSMKCSYFEDLKNRKIEENEILFVNWESLNKKNNIYIKDNEENNNLEAIIQNTKAEGRKIVLIIDESHFSALSEKALVVRDIIGPVVTIECSATPHLFVSNDGMCQIYLEDVKKEGMVVNNVLVNFPGDLSDENNITDKSSIRDGIRRRRRLKKLYEEEGSSVNPLMLIQLPDKQRGMTDNTMGKVLDILKEEGIVDCNIAVWLSEEKTPNLLKIEQNNNQVEVLIFKQAVALGWNCPRAQVMTRLREAKSFNFTTQTIGRITRTAEKKHYSNPELNNAYVFHSFEKCNITGEYVKDYVVNKFSQRKKIYTGLRIPSVYLKRQRERTRLGGEITNKFFEAAEKNNLEIKTNIKNIEIRRLVGIDGEITDVDQKGEIQHKTLKNNLVTDGEEIQQRFNNLIKSFVSGYAFVDSSGRAKTAIYKFCKDKFDLDSGSEGDLLKIQTIVLANYQLWLDTFNLAKEKYEDYLKEKDKQREVEDTLFWEVPEQVFYKAEAEERFYKKYIMDRFYSSKKQSDIELKFQDSIDTKIDNIEWWYKNGENEKKYFSVKYKEPDKNDYCQAFYVDYIIQFKDGSIGLFDTKSGYTIKLASSKAKGLQEYIKKQGKEGKKIFGGIIKYENGSFFLNSSKNLNSDWKIFNGQSPFS